MYNVFQPQLYPNQSPFSTSPYIATPAMQPLQQSIPQQSTQQVGGQLIQVNGLDSAKAYPTQPNSTVVLFDSNEDIMYVKSTDASNFPTIRRFGFTELKDEIPKNDTQYVTMEEFNRFKEEILNGKQFVRNTQSGKSNKWNGQNSTNKADDGHVTEQQ